jgi:hypothetical protein
MCQVIWLVLCSMVWCVYLDTFIIFEISSEWGLIVIDGFSTVYFCFQNYRNTDAVFVSDNIVSFSFLIKRIWKWKWWSFSPMVSYCFHPYFSILIMGSERKYEKKHLIWIFSDCFAGLGWFGYGSVHLFLIFLGRGFKRCCWNNHNRL